jgi:hypothetical protein
LTNGSQALYAPLITYRKIAAFNVRLPAKQTSTKFPCQLSAAQIIKELCNMLANWPLPAQAFAKCAILVMKKINPTAMWVTVHAMASAPCVLFPNSA